MRLRIVRSLELCAAVQVGLLLAVFGCRPSSTDNQTRNRRPVSPDVLQLVSIHSEPDQEHHNKVVDEAGAVWYASVPALNASQVDAQKGAVAGYKNGYCLHLPVREGYRRKLRDWSAPRLGERIAWLYQGRILSVAPIGGVVSHNVPVFTFESYKDAANALEVLKQVGESQGASTELQSMTR